MLDEAKKCLLLGDLVSAKRLYQKIGKDSAEALHGLALIAFQQNRAEEAEDLLLQAIKIKRNDPEYYKSLGIVYQTLECWEKAVWAFEKGVSYYKRPYPEPYYSTLLKLAEILLRQQEFLKAKNLIRKVLKTFPDHLGALKLFAQCEVALFRYASAVKTLEKLPVERHLLEALKVEVFFHKGEYQMALASAKKAVKWEPENPKYYALLGECYIKLYELENSMKAFCKGLELAPTDSKMLSRMLELYIRTCRWEGRGELVAKLAARLPQDAHVIQPAIAMIAGFTNQEIQTIAKARSSLIEAQMEPVRDSLNFQYQRGRRKKIRLGYLSPDFYDHVTAHLMLDIFARHDRKIFEVYAFSYGKKDRSYLRRRIKKDCDHFIEVGHLSDKQVATVINRAGIDILIDLKGHIVNNRLGILALRPAPIQVHYLGYPGTIGASFIDAMIADRVVIPSSQKKYYTEKILYLPRIYQANMKDKIIGKRPKKEQYGLPRDAFVFCCFNQNDKFDPDTVSAWMKILQSVPHSVLWVWANYSGLEKRLVSFGKENGLQPQRFIFCQTEPSPKHLARMQLADLFLDTFNYNAHTTCSDAIRVSLPLLTCPGKTFASRVAASLLRPLKVDEMIAKDQEDYIKKAVFLAKHPDKLHNIRDKMSKNQKTSNLFNPDLFAKELDTALLKLFSC